MHSVSEQVVVLKRQIELHITNASRGELLRNGIRIALLGAPNAGKSSLLNRVVGREAAIVSAEEGTTRDIVDVTVDVKGWLRKMGDMAGLRDQSWSSASKGIPTEIGSVEQEGIRRARERALQSDVVVVLLELELKKGEAPDLAINGEVVLAAQDCLDIGKTVLFAVNKLDLLPNHEPNLWANLRTDLLRKIRALWPKTGSDQIFLISCKDVQTHFTDNSDPGGIQAFLHGLASAFKELTSAVTGQGSSGMSPTEAQAYWTASLSVTHRQSEYLKECLAHLNDFLAQSQFAAATTERASH